MSRFVLAAVGLAAGIIGLAAPASAATLTPLSYTFDQPTNTGAYTYNDTGAELIDGILGTAGWAYNAGVEWDGWVSVPQVNIDFNFGSAKTFNSVSVGSTQDNPFDVVLPNLNIFSSLNGVAWTFRGSLATPVSNANNVSPYSSAPHGFLTVGGLNFSAPFVRVQAVNNGPWIFVDEVRFQGSGGVPEPAAWSLMLLGFGVAGASLRRRRPAQRV